MKNILLTIAGLAIVSTTVFTIINKDNTNKEGVNTTNTQNTAGGGEVLGVSISSVNNIDNLNNQNNNLNTEGVENNTDTKSSEKINKTNEIVDKNTDNKDYSQEINALQKQINTLNAKLSEIDKKSFTTANNLDIPINTTNTNTNWASIFTPNSTQYQFVPTQSTTIVNNPTPTLASLGLNFADNSEVVSTVNPSSFVTAWGDSLTSGGGSTVGNNYPNVLSRILNILVYNNGVGGQGSTQIAVRQGAYQPTVTIVGGEIPATAGATVTVTFPIGYEPVTAQSPANGIKGTLAGIYGTLKYSSGSILFSRDVNGLIVSTTSSTFIIDNRNLNNGISVIWTGRNNFNNVKSDIAAMVANLNGNNKYLILSILNAKTETSTTTSYNIITTLNNDLALTYPNNYFDIRTYLIEHGLEDANITPTPQDLIDINNDTIPTSLSSDGLHLNNYGYKVVAEQVAKFIKENFQTENIVNNIPNVLLASNLSSIFSSPMAIGIAKPNIGTFSSLKSESNIYLPSTQNSTSSEVIGVIYSDGVPFLHNFNYGDNGAVTTVGSNIFLGKNSGNFNMGKMATYNYESSYNTAVGDNTLSSNTTGYNNVALGQGSLKENRTGSLNVAVGVATLFNNINGGSNVAIGLSSLRNSTSSSASVAIGVQSLYSLDAGYGNSSIGINSMLNVTKGDYNVVIGADAGKFISGGSVKLTFMSTSVLLGSLTKALTDGGSNEIVIGYNATGNGSNSVTLGNTSITKTFLRGNIGVGLGTTSPTATLHASGTIRFSSFGAGTLTTDANGNLSVSSDERLKENITPYNRSILDLLKINPISYKWNETSGLDTNNFYTGFSAQNIQNAIPEAVSTSPNGYLSLQDRPIIATIVNALKDQFTTLTGSSTPDMIDNTNATNTLNLIINENNNYNKSVLNIILEKVNNKISIIHDFVVAKITAVVGYFNRVEIENKLCFKKSDGSRFCTDGDTLENAINKINTIGGGGVDAGGSGATGGSGAEEEPESIGGGESADNLDTTVASSTDPENTDNSSSTIPLVNPDDPAPAS